MWSMLDHRHGLGRHGPQVGGPEVVDVDAVEQVGGQLEEPLLEPGGAGVGARGRLGELAEHLGGVLEGLALEQAGEQEVALLPEGELVVEVDVGVLGQEALALQLDEGGGDQQELGGDLEVERAPSSRARPGRRRRCATARSRRGRPARAGSGGAAGRTGPRRPGSAPRTAWRANDRGGRPPCPAAPPPVRIAGMPVAPPSPSPEPAGSRRCWSRRCSSACAGARSAAPSAARRAPRTDAADGGRRRGQRDLPDARLRRGVPRAASSADRRHGPRARSPSTERAVSASTAARPSTAVLDHLHRRPTQWAQAVAGRITAAGPARPTPAKLGTQVECLTTAVQALDDVQRQALLVGLVVIGSAPQTGGLAVQRGDVLNGLLRRRARWSCGTSSTVGPAGPEPVSGRPGADLYDRPP